MLGSDDIYREWGYVAMSRGRTDIWLYLTTSDHDEPADDPTHPEFHQHDPRTPTERLTADLRRSHRQTAATDHLPDPADPADSVRVVDVEVLGDTPVHLIRVLGERPADGEPRRAWATASAAIDRYRAAHGVRDDGLPLGLVPDDPAERDAYRQAMRELLAARRAMAAGLPDGRDVPTHTHGHGIGRDVA